MWFSSIIFFNLFLRLSTFSSLLITVSTTLVLFILFRTRRLFLSLAFLCLPFNSSYLALSLMFSCSSAEVKSLLTLMNYYISCSYLDLNWWFSDVYPSSSCFLIWISLVNWWSSTSVVSSVTWLSMKTSSTSVSTIISSSIILST